MLIRWFEKEETFIKAVCDDKSVVEKFQPQFLEQVRKVSEDHNNSEKVKKLAEAMKDPESFARGDVTVRNMLLTVLTFVNWVRPCGLYNMTILEWDGRMMSRDGNCVVVKVSNHKTGAQFGAQPVILAVETAQIMENYLHHWRPKAKDVEEDKYFFLNTRGASLVNTGVTNLMKKHLTSNDVDVPHNFCATAVRTAASSSIQEQENDELNAMGQQIFCHSAATQKKSYRGSMSSVRCADYHAQLSAAVPYSQQTMFQEVKSVGHPAREEEKEPRLRLNKNLGDYTVSLPSTVKTVFEEMKPFEEVNVSHDVCDEADIESSDDECDEDNKKRKEPETEGVLEQVSKKPRQYRKFPKLSKEEKAEVFSDLKKKNSLDKNLKLKDLRTVLDPKIIRMIQNGSQLNVEQTEEKLLKRICDFARDRALKIEGEFLVFISVFCLCNLCVKKLERQDQVLYKIKASEDFCLASSFGFMINNLNKC